MICFDDVVRYFLISCREFELSTQGGIICDSCDFGALPETYLLFNGTMDQ